MICCPKFTIDNPPVSVTIIGKRANLEVPYGSGANWLGSHFRHDVPRYRYGVDGCLFQALSTEPQEKPISIDQCRVVWSYMAHWCAHRARSNAT